MADAAGQTITIGIDSGSSLLDIAAAGRSGPEAGKTNRREFIKALGLCAGTAALPGFVLALRQRERRPNIVFILADDLGYAELGCYDQQEARKLRLRRGPEYLVAHSVERRRAAAPARDRYRCWPGPSYRRLPLSPWNGRRNQRHDQGL